MTLLFRFAGWAEAAPKTVGASPSILPDGAELIAGI